MSFTPGTKRSVLDTICGLLDTADLLSASLVSRSWRDPAQAALFRSIQFHGMASRAQGAVEFRQKLRDLHRSLLERPALGSYIRYLHYACFRSPEAHERFFNVVRLATGLEFLSFTPLSGMSDNEMIGRYRHAFEQSSFSKMAIVLGKADDVAYVPTRRLRALKLRAGALMSDEYQVDSGWSDGIGTGTANNSGPEPSQVDVSDCKIDTDILAIRGCPDYHPNGIGKDEWYLSSFLANHLVSPGILCLEGCTFTNKALAKLLSACGENICHLTIRQHRSRESKASWDGLSVPVPLDIFRWNRWMPQLTSLAVDNESPPTLDGIKNIERLSWTRSPGRTAYASLQKLTTILQGDFSPQLTHLKLLGNVYDVYDKHNSGDGWGYSIDAAPQIRIEACRALLHDFDKICQKRNLIVSPANFVADCMEILQAHEVIEATKNKAAGADGCGWGIGDITGL